MDNSIIAIVLEDEDGIVYKAAVKKDLVSNPPGIGFTIKGGYYVWEHLCDALPDVEKVNEMMKQVLMNLDYDMSMAN